MIGAAHAAGDAAEIFVLDWFIFREVFSNPCHQIIVDNLRTGFQLLFFLSRLPQFWHHREQARETSLISVERLFVRVAEENIFGMVVDN